jgi:hypothetical protein
MNGAQFDWGEYPLPNGNYLWEANIKSGYIASDEISGSFSISSTCGGATEATTASSSVTNPANPLGGQTNVGSAIRDITIDAADTDTSRPTQNMLPLPRPVIKLFIDNKPLTTPSLSVGDELEFRVTTALATRVRLVMIADSTMGVPLGDAVKDDLLSVTGTDVWSYVWSPRHAYRTLRVYAEVEHVDGRTTLTELSGIEVKEDERGASSVTIDGKYGDVATSVTVLPADLELVAERVKDPSACMNADECQMYCEGFPEAQTECLEFSRAAIALPGRLPSLLDGIPPERIDFILKDVAMRPKEIPEIILSASDLADYCSIPDGFDICTRFLTRNDLATKETIALKKDEVLERRNERRKIFEERVGARAYVDADEDGVADYDEINIYLTDPNSRDSDRDGFADGVELLARTNPRGAPVTSGIAEDRIALPTEETIMPQHPYLSGMLEDEFLLVSNVERVVDVTNSNEEHPPKIRLSGRGLPNSFLTLYIFSDPIIVTLRTNDIGNWTYILDKELPDGTHEVISAITDSGGSIIAKSSPFSFVKTAEAVSVSQTAGRGEKSGGLSSDVTTMYVAIGTALLGVGLSLVGFLARGKRERVTEQSPD